MQRDEKGRFVSSKAADGKTVFQSGFKGFEKGLVCRGKQYAENTVFEEPEAEICECGMHFCENPMDVLEYYPLLNDSCELNEFAPVEALSEPKTDGEKSVTEKLKIGARIGLGGFIKCAVDFSLTWLKKVDYNDASQLAASGDASKLAASGRYSQLAASGDDSSVEATASDCVVASVGKRGKVRGALGCFLACAEWKEDDNGQWHPVVIVSAKVDGKKIKADTWYTVKDGKFTEVEE